SVEAVCSRGRALFERLLAPALREVGEKCERLLVVPTPSLAALPFEALVAGTKGAGAPRAFADLEFVLDRYEVSYAPSAPVLVELASLGPARRDGKVLVLADPRYPSEGSEAPISPQGVPAEAAGLRGVARASPEPVAFRRLEKTREEALALAEMLASGGPKDLAALNDLRDQALTAESFDLYLGAEASPRRLSGDLRRYSILHVAAHGYVDLEFPQRTGIALSFPEGGDGYFTIADALELDLDANLVVLSACETGRGKPQAGEGVESLARAFMYAGARGVVASLWQVADEEAAGTMAAFYRGVIKEGRDPGRALREAKLTVRGRGGSRELRGVGLTSVQSKPTDVEAGHPFFWAPFIHLGLPR
ncbi:MAG TPA: CHAT domain-containing protein, partial [Planctomycetota bacterium]|nr:CHAT domain-containing protein [Planctomycetota bacterium]